MLFPFKKISSLLLFSGDAANGPDPNFLKHAGADIDGSVLLWTKSGKRLITSTMNEGKARASMSFPIQLYSASGSADTIKETVPKGKIGLDYSSIDASRYLRFEKLFGRKRLVDACPSLELLRATKSSDELAKMKKSVAIAKDILRAVELKPSMTELDVVAQLSRRCIDKNVTFSFPPIVGSGASAGKPHHTPSMKKLGTGIVLIDFGVRYQHYCSDLTRCYFLGAAQAERAKYAQCQAIHNAVIDDLPSCQTAGDVVALADREVKKALWPKMIHSIGHGIGLEVHEAPHLYSKSKEKLRENTPMAIEPGWYSSKFGVRYENNVVWGKKKARML
jgi:Xaa-Pro dipeptidase